MGKLRRSRRTYRRRSRTYKKRKNKTKRINKSRRRYRKKSIKVYGGAKLTKSTAIEHIKQVLVKIANNPIFSEKVRVARENILLE